MENPYFRVISRPRLLVPGRWVPTGLEIRVRAHIETKVVCFNEERTLGSKRKVTVPAAGTRNPTCQIAEPLR